MSWYYTYYLGYEKDNKLYPLGPFDANGRLFDVLSRSRSFASDLHERFSPIQESMISDEFRNAFEYTDIDGKQNLDLRYYSCLPLSEFPAGDPMRYGYALVSDVQAYLKAKAADEGGEYDALDEIRYSMLTAGEFAVKAQQELIHGVPQPEYDCEGVEMPVHSCKEYCFFSFIDTQSEEYEAKVIRDAANIFEFSDLIFDRRAWKQEHRIVVILQQG